ncbi:unnamed protein product [Rhizoctonia solani]|uniref:IATP ATPase inhibitor n=1 Tax=Rhizoctonia solani TaxID=456999 RepID=A0A8H3C733_9AGAM|nr:unnamed protein product [Rhizoctonia solani]
MSTGATAQDPTWKGREQGEEARYARAKEQEQLAALRDKLASKDEGNKAKAGDLGIEGGFGGQEDLEDRYATTSGDH